jgi:hypothetical protein
VSSDARRRDPSCVDPRGSPWPTVNGAPPTGFATRRSAVGRRRWDDACGSVERERVNRRVPVAFRSSTTSNPKPRSRETPCLARCGAHAPADGRAMWAAVVYKSWSTGKLKRGFNHGRLSHQSHRHLRVKDFRAPRAEAPPRTRQSAPHTHTSYKRIHSRAIARARPTTHRHIHTSAFKGSSRPTPRVFSRAKRANENAPAPL